MFDAETARILRSAPAMPGLDPANLPAILTRHYAELVSIRLRGVTDERSVEDDAWTLERIADTYELAVSIQPSSDAKAAAAFVAATAQQIIARRLVNLVSDEANFPANIDRDRLDPSLAAVVLFLTAEQYADANEAATFIRRDREQQTYEATILSEHLFDLATGKLNSILERAQRWRRPLAHSDLEERALAALLETLCAGIEMLAAQMLRAETPVQTGGRFEAAQQAFQKVYDLSAATQAFDESVGASDMLVSFPGPHHLASLLLGASDSLLVASLFNTPSPQGSDQATWVKWLRFRAQKFPYVWPNHRKAITQKFYETGVSAVVVLPTGAGKTTVSALKIAGALARGKKVAFLAPTHALVEQLTEDLQEMFPADILGSTVSNDFDLLMQEDATFQGIEVMTPERCLAMLSFAPEAFQDVGLLVFDECHLLSPESGKIRRALDAMLCVLGFNHVAPEADILFLSAMLKNGEELSQWLGSLTGRPSIPVDLVWKPSRQAPGVVMYNQDEVRESRLRANEKQQSENKRLNKEAASLRKPAARELVATPYAIWGLQHNWLSQDRSRAWIITTQILEDKVTLAGNINYGSLRVTPNSNQVAVDLAAAAAGRGLKTIVFVNTKNDAVKVAKDISEQLATQLAPTDAEQARWDALAEELGDLAHSLLSGPSAAVPHNSAMLRLERDLAEKMFKRPNGAQVIVATPTLAQGLNLPAQLAILAGDKRAGGEGREALEAHEILNAAARAGRAGHLANGLVLLIPEPIIQYKPGQPFDHTVVSKLETLIPEDDHCVRVNDPLEVVLDRLMAGQATDPDVAYTVNRMAALESVESYTSSHIFDLGRSLGAFAAQRRKELAEFDVKVAQLRAAIASQKVDGLDTTIAALATQSGLSATLLLGLKARLLAGLNSLPVDLVGWLEWSLDWFKDDEVARASLLIDINGNILAACGRPKTSNVRNEDLDKICDALVAWVTGETVQSIELVLGGKPIGGSPTEIRCPRARELIGSVIPRGMSFTLGLVAHVLSEIVPLDEREDIDRQLIESMGTLLRKGYLSPEMIFFAADRKVLLSRVQVHKAWATRFDDVFESFD
ncbi:DEAD/DEAH box helicase [Parasphingorhabdus sp.]|uniref:DEAD/DEAH box helicase n=1 Tax=Parasphingorhabdus sp. TaxID=2709688 RepID=UPI003BB00C12